MAGVEHALGQSSDGTVFRKGPAIVSWLRTRLCKYFPVFSNLNMSPTFWTKITLLERFENAIGGLDARKLKGQMNFAELSDVVGPGLASDLLLEYGKRL